MIEDGGAAQAGHSSLTSETAHLLKSPANAVRLLSALDRALMGEGEPSSPGELRRMVDPPDDQ